ncbi:hypothetical protein [Kordiimonas aestuarii]|uniref:hypothetical protein n=1 Tax=Kordiimonas aestuarii TaxID=1005925 RepID=UPI0021D27D39|nr:hypothetical protein [Kordiimonas aestuarii]
MSDNPFIKKRQRSRRKATFLLGTRNIIGLVVLSLVAYAAFRLWVGNPADTMCDGECESMYSLFASVLGFFMMFAAVITAGAVIGLVVALMRRTAGSGESTFARMHRDAESREDHPPQ